MRGMIIYHRSIFLSLMVGVMLLSFSMEAAWAEEVYDCNAEENRKKISLLVKEFKKIKKKTK